MPLPSNILPLICRLSRVRPSPSYRCSPPSHFRVHFSPNSRHFPGFDTQPRSWSSTAGNRRFVMGSSDPSPGSQDVKMQDAKATSLLQGYQFPTQRLKRVLNDGSKTPLVLVGCGSFSPITYLHLRMFEMARDYCQFNTKYEVIGGYLSPVGDAYKKAGLASAHHRINMCQLAVQDASTWIMVDAWEPLQSDYQPTARVLDRFDYELNEVHGGIHVGGQRSRIHVALLAGADLIQTMSTPGVWSPQDLDHILGQYGTFIIERAGTDIDEALATLQQWKDNIHVIPQLIQNDISSTKVRLFLKREMSVRYLIPHPVVRYIEENGLYGEDGSAPSQEKEEKGKTPVTPGQPGTAK